MVRIFFYLRFFPLQFFFIPLFFLSFEIYQEKKKFKLLGLSHGSFSHL